MSRNSHNLLILSDVHLGSDLVHHARPDAPRRSRASIRRDHDLVALLVWYRNHRRRNQPWRLVIAGDFVDFVGMSVTAPAELETDLSEEEREHGLGSAVEHAVLKLRLVAQHHERVFSELAAFLAAGNSLVILRGNHDLDLHWPAVKQAFVQVLEAHAAFDPGQIEFADWFYYEEGLVYVEHGHQYDVYCSFDNLLHPVSPLDPRRSVASFSDVLIRYVVRPTPGMSEAGHEKAGPFDYLRFAYRLGRRGMVSLASRFLSATVALIRLWREHASGAADWVRREHERKMALLAEAKHIGLERLRALSRLQRPPVTRSLMLLLASIMLDRVVIVLTALGVLVFLSTATDGWAERVGIGAAAACALTGVGLLWRRQRENVDASAALRDRAPSLAKLFPAAFVVMGHTHLPEVHSHSSDVTYVNLGAWAEEDADGGAAPHLPATRTHLVLERSGDGANAMLLTWDSNRGPRQFARSDGDSEAPPSAPHAA